MSEINKYTDRFIRKTVYIEKGVLEALLELSASRKGEQTRIINAALAEYRKNPKAKYAKPPLEAMQRKTVYMDSDILDWFLTSTADIPGAQPELIHNALTSYLEDPANVEKHSDVADWWKKPFWNKIHIHGKDE
jgi:uncharacterized protein (DUF4415 family)